MLKKACGYLRGGKSEKASKILKKLASNNPGWYDAFYNLGVSYMVQKRWQDAVSAFYNAIEIIPESCDACSNLSVSLSQVGEFEKALEYGKIGFLLNPFNISIYSALAVALENLDQFDEAVSYLRRALLINNNDLDTLKSLWGVLFRSGQKKEAEEVALRYLQLKPDDAPMHRMLSLSRSYTVDDKHIAQMEGLSKSASENVDLHFALGKAYEDVGEYKRSFEHYDSGNALLHKILKYRVENDTVFFDRIRQIFTKDFIQQNKLSWRDETPIFVTGMPRSGTSLVEQILASHPDVYGAGETSYLTKIQYGDMGLNNRDYANSIKNLKPVDFEKIADLYLKKFGRVCGDHRYITDKTIQNFFYLGLIKIIFPKAKIIHCKRDPRDTCFSIFKTYFLNPVPFAYSQKDITDFYELYKNFMAHWRSVLPGEIYDLDYETLVESPEETIRGLLKHCDLEWHDECVAFHKTKRTVSTASTLQVRKPLYKGAVGYWKNYEPYLDEIVSNFESGGD